MMTTIVISAGRNVLTEPMDASNWILLHENIRFTLNLHKAHVFTNRALGDGDYEGQAEESVTYVASVRTIDIPDIQADLARISKLFGQESIALMKVSETIFC